MFGDCTYSGELYVIYTLVKQCHTPETNKTLPVTYTSVKQIATNNLKPLVVRGLFLFQHREIYQMYIPTCKVEDTSWGIMEKS